MSGHTNVAFEPDKVIGTDDVVMTKVKDEDDGEEKDDETIKSVSILQLFRFAKTADKILIVISTICAILHGITFQILLLTFGDLIDAFVDNTDHAVPSNQTTVDSTSSASSAITSVSPIALRFTIAGCCVIPFAYGQFTCIFMSSRRQAHAIRVALFRAIVKQEMAWFDTHQVSELNVKLVTCVDQIEDGIGDKATTFIQMMTTFIAAVVTSLVLSWKLCLVVMSLSPLFLSAGLFMTYIIPIMNGMELKAYAKAGTVAQEVLSAIKTVIVFGGEKKESDRYNSHVDTARKFGIKKAAFFGLGMAMIATSLYFGYSLAFWYGAKLTRDGEMSAGNILTIFLSIMIGLNSFGGGVAYFQDLGQARNAAYSVWQWIDSQPSIDITSKDGLTPDRMKGDIILKNVKFSYPSRPDISILNGVNLSVRVGKTVALVGSSGSGKSTVVQLLQRFYDPLEGAVQIDECDIRSLNLSWLRKHIGIVSQEPNLFATTIGENIRFGRDSATADDVVAAAKAANVHDFISTLPEAYDTLVGERGAQLSGGQKQRIAIARALVGDPKILLLDEATSALDNESEALVQAALDKARDGRTTVIVAHRLSTIQTADHIVGMQKGQVIEEGNHAELMAKQGLYYELVTNQSDMSEKKDTENANGVTAVEKPADQQDGTGMRSLSVTSELNGGSIKIGQKEEEEEEPNVPSPLKRVLKMNAPEWPYILVGCVMALLLGAQYPAYALILSEVIGAFNIPDLSEQENTINSYALMMFCIGIAVGVATAIERWVFGVAAEWLTMRIRKITFASFLRQDMSFFDDAENETGKLSARLANDATVVHGASGIRVATMLQIITTLIACAAVGLYYCWYLSLLILATIPLTMGATMVKMKMQRGDVGTRHGPLEESAKIATETMMNIRTVASLTKQQYFSDKYANLLNSSFGWLSKNMHIPGLAFGIGQGLMFFTMAVTFYFGAWLIDNKEYNFISIFKVFAVLVIATMQLARDGSTMPDFQKAKIAATRIFSLLDRVPTIRGVDGDSKTMNNVTGTVEFKNVRFSYPSRPTVPVLRGLSLRIEAGQTVALVGTSGCGKSTSLQLLQRFYDSSSGQVLLDGVDTRTLDVEWLRAQFGVVFQEPTLFNCSVRDNIAYGDTTRVVSMDEIIAAARKANIHEFISSLPQGYDSNVGDRATQLSGGQKQRIAIARALVRDPKLLLLDEATSALDTESEKVVQEALERAMVGRTSIVIAHRLSTIQNADCIIVLHKGVVTELGTHAQLLAHKGIYYKFHQKTQH